MNRLQGTAYNVRRSYDTSPASSTGSAAKSSSRAGLLPVGATPPLPPAHSEAAQGSDVSSPDGSVSRLPARYGRRRNLSPAGSVSTEGDAAGDDHFFTPASRTVGEGATPATRASFGSRIPTPGSGAAGALADSMRARAAESEKLKDELSSVKQSKGVLIRQNIMLTQEVQELQSKVEEAEKKGQVLQTHFSVADASKEATRRVSLACWSQVAERRQPSSRVQRPWLPVWEGCQGGPMESWLGEWAALWAAADLLASAVQAVTFPALPDVLRPPRVRPPTACLQTLTDVTMQSAAAAAERDHLKAVVQGQAGQLQELQGQLHTREQALQASVAGIAAAVMGNRLAAAPPPPPNLSCICMSVLGRGVEGVRD